MEKTIVEIGLLLDDDVQTYIDMLEKQGFENIFSCETHDLYWTNKKRADLEKMTESEIKNACVRLREVWAYGGTKFNGDFNESYAFSNYKIFDSKKPDRIKTTKDKYKKQIEEIEGKDWLLYFDTFKRDYQYKLGGVVLQLQEIDGIGLVLYYDNEEYYHLEESQQRKRLIDDLNSFGFKFSESEQGIDKLRTLLMGCPQFSNNQNR